MHALDSIKMFGPVSDYTALLKLSVVNPSVFICFGIDEFIFIFGWYTGALSNKDNSMESC